MKLGDLIPNSMLYPQAQSCLLARDLEMSREARSFPPPREKQFPALCLVKKQPLLWEVTIQTCTLVGVYACPGPGIGRSGFKNQYSGGLGILSLLISLNLVSHLVTGAVRPDLAELFW